MLNIMLRALIILLVLLGVGAAALCLYNRYYRNRANHILEDKLNGKDSDVAPAPAPHTVWKVILVLVLFVAFCAWEIDRSKELSELRQSWEVTYSTVSQTYSTVNSINARLAEMQRIFVSFDYEITDVNVPARSATVSFRAVPKTATPDAAVTLSYNNETITLVRDESGTYTGSTKLSLFGEQEESGILCLTDLGQSKTETVTIYPDLRSFFPQISFSLIYDDVRLDDYTLYLSGQPELTVWMPEKIHSIHLLFVQKDEVLKDLDLTSAMWQQIQLPYLQEEFSSLSPVRVVLRWEDSYGLIHEVEHSGFAQSSTGDDIVYMEQPDGLEMIYDTEGNFLGELR